MKVSNNKNILSTISFACILLLALVFAGFYFYNIVKWSEHPDCGYSFRGQTGAKFVGFLRDPGRKAGLRIGDYILEVNGKTYSTLEELREIFNWEIGDKNTYLIERDGQNLEITITNAPFGYKLAFSKCGPLYLVGLCYIFIGALVFVMKPHEKSSWIFFLFTTVSGQYLVFSYKLGRLEPSFMESFVIFVYAFVPAVITQLAFSFPQERRILTKFPYVQIFIYIASGILFLYILRVSPSSADIPRTWQIVVVLCQAGAILFFLASCIQLWLTSESEIVKLRAKIILLGSAISGLIPAASLMSEAIFHSYILKDVNYQIPFYVVFPLFVGYSIVKHDLFDFDSFIKRTYGYVITTGAIAGVYGIFVLVSDVIFGRFEITKSPIFPLIFVLAVVFLFNPIRNRAQKFIDRVFYRLEYDYQDTVHKISETMRSLLKLDEIGKNIMNISLRTLFVDAGGIMLLNPGKGMYEYLITAGKREVRRTGVDMKDTFRPNVRKNVKDKVPIETQKSGATERDIHDSLLSKIQFSINEPFIQKIAEKKKEVTVYDIQEDSFFEDQRELCKKAFDQLQATLIIPLIYEDKLTGLISLGEKKSGKFYRREDINLLNILANQGAVAIENARMIEEVIEKERMEEELSIARDLQTSMLPAECPKIKGFEIAAYSVSAREVGGDFYDFIEMGEDKVGMVIGDVTGKSVSGALVMSASRSVFRMLSEENLGVGEIMIRANRRTKKDIKSGMFVALLYAVLNSEDRTLSLCSAGQTQPIHWSSETNESRLVETKGDTFPLGILEDVGYQETRLYLSPGDKIVLYTDGIVEAMNEKEEIFGFDRLLEIVQEARSMTADSLLKEILDRVNAFAGGAAQHDDLTVIVIGADG